MEAALQVGFIALFMGLGLVWPRAKGDGLGGHDSVVNLATGAGLFGLRVTAIAWVATRSQVHIIDMGFITHPIAQFAFAFLLTDFLRYWLHRLHHRVPLLWSFHRVHHSSKVLNSTSGLRMHVVDFVQLSALPILCFGVLFDVTTFHTGVWFALGAVVGFMDAFQHANLAVDTSNPALRAWDKLFNNPHFHSWHHTREVEVYGDGNYGQALTLWDRLFGTCVSQAPACERLGLSEDQDLRPDALGLQMLRTQAPPEQG